MVLQDVSVARPSALRASVFWSESPLPHHLSCVLAMSCRTRYEELSIYGRSPFCIQSKSKHPNVCATEADVGTRRLALSAFLRGVLAII